MVLKKKSLIVQRLERMTVNHEVIGSSPIKPKNISGVIVLMVKILGCHLEDIGSNPVYSV